METVYFLGFDGLVFLVFVRDLGIVTARQAVVAVLRQGRLGAGLQIVTVARQTCRAQLDNL